MDWPTAAVALGTIAAVIGSFTTIFVNKKKDKKDEGGCPPGTISPELATKITALETNQVNLKDTVDGFKRDMKEDITELHRKMDTKFDDVTKLIIDLCKRD